MEEQSGDEWRELDECGGLHACACGCKTAQVVYDPLGRLQSIGDYDGPPVPNPTYRRQVVYSYNNTTGRLQMEQYFPNGSYVEYTYYGADNPSQVGFVWKVEHKKSDGSLLIGYEYTYDLLGRVEQSVERPSGDTTVYTYTPAGRLESEVREGQVWYSRYYAYNLDGSRAMVMRDDALNGSHWDVYSYDEVSGRLASVQDVWTGEANGFAWNPEGTLARWEAPNSYARVFGYDEEGHLVKIERDYGGGDVQVAYEYGYNSDGVRVWKRDVLAGQEYRYVCRIGCGGVPMRVYNRAMGGSGWVSVEDYLPAGNVLGYNQHWRYRYSGGELLMMGATGEPSGYYPTDSNGLPVGQTPPVACVCLVALVPDVCAPLGYGGCGGGQCEEMPSIWFPVDRENCWLQIPPIPLPRICGVGGRFGSCIAVCPPGSGAYCIEVRGNVTCSCDNGGSCAANCKEGSCRVTCPPGSVAVCICEADLAVCGCRPVRPRV